MTNPPTADRMSDEDWLKSYDAQITERSGFPGSYSQTIGTKETLDFFRVVGDPFDNEPEDAAEEEMSNWDDDGDEEDDEWDGDENW